MGHRPLIKHCSTQESWNRTYLISFTLPFFAIGRSGRQDKRTLHDNKLNFRARYDLDSLHPEDSTPSEGKLVLHEGVYSFSTTGLNEEHWTSYCFDDEFFESEPRLLEDEEEIESGESSIDPIIDEVDVSDTATQWRPRQYSLAALAAQLERIREHHSHVHEVFKQGLASYVSALLHKSMHLTWALLETVNHPCLANIYADKKY